MSNYSFNYYQYKNKIYKKNPFTFSIIFLFIIILLGLCVFLKPTKNKYYKFYFVEIDSCDTYKDAVDVANSLQERGGAGYIFFDKEYHVLASFYAEHDHAKSISNKLKTEYKNTGVLTLEIKKFIKVSSLNSTQNQAVENLTSKLREQTFELENLSNRFDAKKISYNELYIHIENIKKEFNDKHDKYLSAFKNLSKYNLSKEYLEKIKISFDMILNSIEQDISQTLRYHIINIAINYHHLLSCF